MAEERLLITGYRGYNLVTSYTVNNHPVLAGLFGYIWPSRSMIAECDENHKKHIPSKNCSCGIYALSTLEEMFNLRFNVLFMTKCALYGRVLEGTKGYRAEKVEILEILVPSCQYCPAPSDYVLGHSLAGGLWLCTQCYEKQGFGMNAINIQQMANYYDVPVVHVPLLDHFRRAKISERMLPVFQRIAPGVQPLTSVDQFIYEMQKRWMLQFFAAVMIAFAIMSSAIINLIRH
jgi:hypothetical protein